MIYFLKFYFDITLTCFLSPHFSFFLCDKFSVVISKVHYKSIIFIIKKLIKLILNMALNFMFLCNQKKITSVTI
jgi:hypothetical protein